MAIDSEPFSLEWRVYDRFMKPPISSLERADRGFNAGAFYDGVPHARVVGLRVGTTPVAP